MKHTTDRGKDSTQLTQRDIEILRYVQSAEVKKAGEIAKMFWGERSRRANAGFQRVRKLIRAGFLKPGDPKHLYLSDQAKGLLQKPMEGAEASSNG